LSDAIIGASVASTQNAEDRADVRHCWTIHQRQNT
jgi:hypothetical protein